VTGIDPAADRAHAATFAHPDLEQIDQQATFDVRGYAASATGIRPETVDLSEFEQRPLGDRSCGAVRLLVGAMSGTIAQLRDILVTPSHLESRLTAFLTTRAFEHYWSAHTLSLIADPSRAGEPLYAGPPSDTTRLDLAAWRPVRRAITSNLLGHDHVAQTATLGLVDSLLTARVARRLPDLDGRLSDVAGRLVDITSTHRAPPCSLLARPLDHAARAAVVRLARSPPRRHTVARAPAAPLGPGPGLGPSRRAARPVPDARAAVGPHGRRPRRG
jgi:hypothetical protein